VLGASLDGADAVIMAAAVADFRPAQRQPKKIKKAPGPPAAIDLAANPDLIAGIAARRTAKRPLLVAFALETGDDAAVLAYAEQKLRAKRVDVVVANAAHESLGRVDNRVAIVGHGGASPFVLATKEEVAETILDRVAGGLAISE
jgi:phosphopantothenoylcysteine decarboxylase/phosphopantothenate--cysteine ligase